MSQTCVLPLLLLGAVFLCCSIGQTQAQENIMPQIPPSLAECYNTSYFMNRQNRLPANIETLISLIEKVENTPNSNYDMRTLSVALLQRFRQDGIQRAWNVAESPGVIPYSPTGFQFPKFRILLSRLIPGNAMNFPNETLTREERCSFHFMLSSSIDTHVRGDESQMCNRLSQYRAQRLRRSPNNERSNSMIGDVEVLESLRTGMEKRGLKQMGAYSSYKNDWGWINSGYSSNNDISQCPVENGVIWTPWGTVSAGALIAGIATGLQQQSVQLRTLLALSSRQNGYQSLPQTATVNVDNRWAATLAGDLSEVALVQVPFTSTETASVGANGAWNSTVMPKWYFLTQRQNFEMTDAEIRGGLDGLIIAKNIVSWVNQANSMKLSQLLRMYYSTSGVLNTGIMACNRKTNFNTYATADEMIKQTSAFSQVLDREMQLGVTLSSANIAQFSQLAVAALQTYVPNSLNDVTCSVSSSTNVDMTNVTTPMTNIYVFLDTTWQYTNIVDYVNYILQRLNVNPYASSLTLLAANNGSIIVNTTNYLPDLFQGWNVTTQAQYTNGFNLPTVLQTITNITQAYMAAEQTNSSVGGRSLVALLIPYSTVQVSSSDSTYATTQLQYIYEQIPDLHFVYYTSGVINRFATFVRNPSTDLFTLNIASTAASSSGPVVSRIVQFQRRLINPRCGSNWYTSSWGTDQLTQYIYPNATNFYRMVPNYFYGAGSNRNVGIQSTSGIEFTICTSRTVPQPTQYNATNYNGGSSDITCATIGSGFTYDLSNACNGYSYINQCPPLYISVQSPATEEASVSCTDNACQAPNQARYIISVTNLGCYSGVAGLFASFATIVLAYFLREALQ